MRKIIVGAQVSTELVHALLANDLVDAMSLFTVPIVLGGGKNTVTAIDRRWTLRYQEG